MIAYLKSAMVLAAVAFILHLVWEKTHIVLYTGYESLEGGFPVYLFATFGDVMYTCIGVGAALLLGARFFGAMRPRDYALLAGIGLMLAIFVETKAMWLGRWHYTDAMPLIYGFGISPLLQMTLLLPLSVWITAVLSRRFEERPHL